MRTDDGRLASPHIRWPKPEPTMARTRSPQVCRPPTSITARPRLPTRLTTTPQAGHTTRTGRATGRAPHTTARRPARRLVRRRKPDGSAFPATRWSSPFSCHRRSARPPPPVAIWAPGQHCHPPNVGDPPRPPTSTCAVLRHVYTRCVPITEKPGSRCSPTGSSGPRCSATPPLSAWRRYKTLPHSSHRLLALEAVVGNRVPEGRMGHWAAWAGPYSYVFGPGRGARRPLRCGAHVRPRCGSVIRPHQHTSGARDGRAPRTQHRR